MRTDDPTSGARRDPVRRATGALYGFLKGNRLLDKVAVGISRAVREAPPSSPLNVVLGPLRARFRGEMAGHDVLAVVDALQEAGITFWIAGGWGVDVLAGAQSRRHDDLDVVLADYEADEPRALGALEPLGYRRVEVLDGLWMNPRSLVDDKAGHQIEVLGFDLPRLEAALPALGKRSARARQARVDQRAPHLFTTGRIEGRPVPCLSVELQLLFHTGFELRGVDGPDIQRLQAMSATGDVTPSR